jgi:hypothetical protein
MKAFRMAVLAAIPAMFVAGVLYAAQYNFFNGMKVEMTTGNLVLNSGTLASFGTCATARAGEVGYATDLTAPTYNATASASGAVSAVIVCNGTNWTTP